jgi:alkyl hydroperoxide reductase subunit AhpC
MKGSRFKSGRRLVKSCLLPLLADCEPKGEVSRAYHLYRSREGTSERALYVIDAEGVVHWSYVSSVGINRGADGILRALEELQGRTGR